jgi:hypothetical protein
LSHWAKLALEREHVEIDAGLTMTILAAQQ